MSLLSRPGSAVAQLRPGTVSASASLVKMHDDLEYPIGLTCVRGPVREEKSLCSLPLPVVDKQTNQALGS